MTCVGARALAASTASPALLFDAHLRPLYQPLSWHVLQAVVNTKPYGEGLTIILLHRAAQPAKQLVRVSGYCGNSCDGELLTWQVRPVRDTLSPT